MKQISVLSIALVCLVVGCSTTNVYNVSTAPSNEDGDGGTTSTSSETTSDTTSTTTTTVTTTSTTTTTTDTSSGTGGAGGSVEEGGAGGSEPSCTKKVTYTMNQPYSQQITPDQMVVMLEMWVTVDDCGDVPLQRISLMLEDSTDDISSFCDGYCHGPYNWSWESKLSSVGGMYADLVGTPEMALSSDGVSEHPVMRFVYEDAAQDLKFAAGTTTLVALALKVKSDTPIGRSFLAWMSEFNPMYEPGYEYTGSPVTASFTVVAP